MKIKGRKFPERHKMLSLIPYHMKSLKNIVQVGAGSFHSFAIDKDGRVWTWGLNLSVCLFALYYGLFLMQVLEPMWPDPGRRWD